jgi:hypothetical protein
MEVKKEQMKMHQSLDIRGYFMYYYDLLFQPLGIFLCRSFQILQGILVRKQGVHFFFNLHVICVINKISGISY